MALTGREPRAAVPDEVLVARAQAGDRLAADVLVRRYQRVAYAIARPLSTHLTDTDDMRQEALHGVLGAIRSYRPGLGPTFQSFVKVCVTRWCFTVIVRDRRGMRRAELTPAALDANDGDFNEPYYVAVEDPLAVNPSVALERKEELAAVVRIVSSELSPLERAAVVGLMNGESYAETANRLGLDVRTTADGCLRSKQVDNALQRARRKVLAALEEAA